VRHAASSPRVQRLRDIGGLLLVELDDLLEALSGARFILLSGPRRDWVRRLDRAGLQRRGGLRVLESRELRFLHFGGALAARASRMELMAGRRPNQINNTAMSRMAAR